MRRTFSIQHKRVDHRFAHEHGFTFVELAFALGIFLVLIITAGYLYNYIRVSQALRFAADAAATVASSDDPTILQWKTNGTTPLRAQLALYSDQCRGSNGSACLDALLSQNRLTALGWSGADFSPKFSKTHSLPFDLFEAPSSANGEPRGYFPVQALPMIGIERGCFEVFNETGSSIPLTPQRFYGSANANDCMHVKPMYWQSSQKADFDGDGKEDAVFFKPRGSNLTWGANAPDADVDFIVFYSGGAYSEIYGHGYFNLTTARTLVDAPHPIPIVADYDRDGISDYAVFEPETGKYRIAFSSVHYRVIGEGFAGVNDPTGVKGLIAIPGAFSLPTQMDLVVVQTAAANATNRFDTFYTRISSSFTYANLETALVTGTLSLPNGSNLTAAMGSNGYKLKPQRDLVSVPAFADYDDDGIVELGYLSWSGGSMSTQVLGKVKRASNNFTSVPLFETNDSLSVDPLNFRVNPFEVVFDRAGNMYLSDAVDHRIWRIDADNSARGTFNGPRTEQVIMPSHTLLAARSSVPSFNPVNDFPRENLWNVPLTDTRNPVDALAEATAQPARGRALKYPRRLAIANNYDGAMYVADWGNGRIIRVDGTGGGILPGNNSTVILGSKTCAAAPATCTNLRDLTTAGGFDTWSAANGKFNVWPSALAIIPDRTNSGRYFLAFSTQNAVYLITHTAATGGPKGSPTDRIYKVAGRRATSPGGSSSSPVATRYLTIRAPAQNSVICPISDLLYNPTGNGVLYAASSCSLRTTATAAPNLRRSVGGILSITSSVPTNNFTNTNVIAQYAGTLFANMCGTAGRCSEPRGAGGIYQRRIDINANRTAVDIMNPVDLALGPRNNLLFVNQWNSDADDNTKQGAAAAATKPYPLAPGRTDQQHQHGVYMIDADTNTVMPLTNPQMYGQNTIPVEGVDWRSPYTLGSASPTVLDIPAHEAPLRSMPFPAQGAVDIFNSKLYAASPFLSNPLSYATGQYYPTDPAKIGFVYKFNFDQDGDGIDDFTDADSDGDGRLNASENSASTSGLSSNCAEIYGASNGTCRTQDKLGLPRWYFFKLSSSASGVLRLNGKGSLAAPVAATYAEFLLFNSVAECADSAMCKPSAVGGFAGMVARPEVWASLFNFGDDIDFSGTAAMCPLVDTNATSPYYGCSATSNGPIAAPQALHAFVGNYQSATSYPFSSYPGDKFLEGLKIGMRKADPGLFKFPVILSSSMPKENGIKSTRRVSLDTSKDPRIKKSGVLCWDGRSEIYSTSVTGASVTAPVPLLPFKFDYSNYLLSYSYSGLRTSEDSITDNDNLNYLANCNAGTLPTFVDGRVPGVEALVLELDHDDTLAKESGSGAAPQWPDKSIVGPPDAPENQRQLVFLDHDGSGVRHPTWLSADSYLPGTARALDNGGAYVMTSSGLMNASIAEARDFDLNYLKDARLPFNKDTLFDSKGWMPLGSAKPGFYLESNNSRNLTFDRGKQLLNHQYGLWVGLDFEPFAARALKQASLSAIPDVGASMFANYTSSNRFRKVGSNEPPVIVVAQNALKISLGVKSFATDPSALSDKQGFVTLLDKTGAICAQYATGQGTEPCTDVLVAYQMKYLGSPVVVKAKKPIILNPASEKCDPDAGAAHPCQ